MQTDSIEISQELCLERTLRFAIGMAFLGGGGENLQGAGTEPGNLMRHGGLGMKLSATQRERLEQIAQEAKEIMGGCLRPDGRPMTFAELEDECIEAGDLLTAAVLQHGSRSGIRPKQAPVVQLVSARESRIRTNRVCCRPIGARCPGWSRLSTVATVGGLFFPRSAELGLAVEDTVSPRVLAKMVYSGTSAASFAEASNDLANLADLSISAERVRRACGRVGSDRIEHHQRLQEAFQSKPLPEQLTANRPTCRLPRSLA